MNLFLPPAPHIFTSTSLPTQGTYDSSSTYQMPSPEQSQSHSQTEQRAPPPPVSVALTRPSLGCRGRCSASPQKPLNPFHLTSGLHNELSLWSHNLQ